jgi:hypothetical protein
MKILITWMRDDGYSEQKTVMVEPDDHYKILQFSQMRDFKAYTLTEDTAEIVKHAINRKARSVADKAALQKRERRQQYEELKKEFENDG